MVSVDFRKVSREKAGELGRRRIGTVEFLNYELCLITFFAFTFFFLVSVSFGNDQLSFSDARKLGGEQA